MLILLERKSFLAWAEILSLKQKLTRNTLVPVLFLLKQEYPCLSKNLLLLEPKSSRSCENEPERMPKFQLNSVEREPLAWVKYTEEITYFSQKNISTYEIIYYSQISKHIQLHETTISPCLTTFQTSFNLPKFQLQCFTIPVQLSIFIKPNTLNYKTLLLPLPSTQANIILS